MTIFTKIAQPADMPAWSDGNYWEEDDPNHIVTWDDGLGHQTAGEPPEREVGKTMSRMSDLSRYMTQ